MAALEDADESRDNVSEIETKSANSSLWRSVASHMYSRRMRVTELFSMIDKDKNKAVSKSELLDFLKTIGIDADKDALKDAFTLEGKLEKELSLSQLKSEVTRFSRELAEMGVANPRPKSPARSRSPPKASGYGQSTSSSTARSKAGVSSRVNSTDSDSKSSVKTKPKATTTKPKATSHAMGATQASTAKAKQDKSPSKVRPKEISPSKSRPITTKEKSPNKTRPPVAAKPVNTAKSPQASSGMDALSALAEASGDNSPTVAPVRRRPSDSEIGVSLVGMSEDWEEAAKKKKEGVVIAFDKKGAKAAELLHEDLVDLKVDMKPLYEATGDKKENFDDYKASLDSAVLLVVLRTVSYGKEPKNAVEIKQIKSGVTSTLVLDLCGEDEEPHLSTLLKVGEDLQPNQVYRTPGGWDPHAEEIPTGMSAHVVNFMIAEQSKSASYNNDPSEMFAATSNAKPRRLSLIDLDNMGDEEETEKPPPPTPDIAADEETFQRFQQEEAEEEENMDAAFQRFQMEQAEEQGE